MLVDRSRWQLEVHAKGVEREPVVVIDHFLANPAALIEEAAALSFTPMAEYYPGVRAPASPTTRAGVIESLLPIFREFFDIRDSIQVQALVYSLVTTAPADLTPIQRLPHYDGTERGNSLSCFIFVVIQQGKPTPAVAPAFTDIAAPVTRRSRPNALPPSAMPCNAMSLITVCQTRATSLATRPSTSGYSGLLRYSIVH